MCMSVLTLYHAFLVNCGFKVDIKEGSVNTQDFSSTSNLLWIFHIFVFLYQLRIIFIYFEQRQSVEIWMRTALSVLGIICADTHISIRNMLLFLFRVSPTFLSNAS